MKQGLEAAPLEELVARAEERFLALRPEIVTPKQPDLFTLQPPVPPPLPDRPAAPSEPVLPVPYEPPEEPFAAATSADLGWDRTSGEVPAVVVAPVERMPAEPAEEGSGPSATGAAEVEMGGAPEESRPEAGEKQDATARRGLWILAIAAVVFVAAGLVWLVSRLLSPPTAPGRAASTATIEMPAPPVLPPASGPVAAPAPTPVPEPTRVPAPVARPAPSRGRVPSFVTRDWAGRSPVFIVHFASHQNRATAESDAAKLASAFGKPAHAVEVDLGAKGIWYRVVVGEFPTAEEARAFRAALAAKKTPGVSFVYEMRGAP